MAKDISGNVVNKISFEIDRRSWQNLDKFQKRIADVKKQLSGLSGNIKVNAVVSSINKVTRATTAGIQQINRARGGASNKASKTLFADMLRNEQKEISLAHSQALKDNKSFIAKEKAQLKERQKNFGAFVQQRFGGNTSGNKAGSTLFADMLRRENQEIGQAHAEALRMNKQFNAQRTQQAMNQRRVDNARNMMITRLQGASPSARATALARFDGANGVEGFAQQMLAGKMTATEFSRAVNQSTSSLLRQSSASKNAQMSMRGLRSELIQATAAYSAFAVGANIFKTGKEFDSLEAGMTLFAGNEAGVKETMSFLRSESERLGTNFEQAAQAYMKFAIVSRNKLTQGETRGLFTGLSEYATVMQVDQYRFQRAMMAIQQI